ncbi:hypothetical protein RYX36_027826 [Vicia faba]
MKWIFIFGMNGPLKYWSMTVFNDISAEMLRNFYMDNHYRKQWDNTVVEHNQLQLDESDGSEVGRTVKKIVCFVYQLVGYSRSAALDLQLATLALHYTIPMLTVLASRPLLRF